MHRYVKEDDICLHIKQILHSYQELIGATYTPDLSEYLALRRAATEELIKNIVDSRPPAARPDTTAPAREPERPRQCPAIWVVPKEDRQTPQTDIPADEPLDRHKETTDPGRTKTGFDTLKNLADPWN